MSIVSPAKQLRIFPIGRNLAVLGREAVAMALKSAKGVARVPAVYMEALNTARAAAADFEKFKRNDHGRPHEISPARAVFVRHFMQ